MTRTSRGLALGLTLAGCAFAVLAHAMVLGASGQDPVATPVGALSSTPLGAWHGAGIAAFALAHLSLAWLLGHRPTGALRQVARVCLVLAAAALVYVAAWFASVDPATLARDGVNDRLPVPASLVGAAMGFLLPGLWRTDRAAGLFDAACFVLWLALTAAVPLVTPAWIGAYERAVGAVYVAWAAGTALFAAASRSA